MFLDKIPTKEDNPTGLHRRYAVTKADGMPCDPDAVYLVLRLDSGGSDPHYVRACRNAAETLAMQLCADGDDPLWEMGSDLFRLLVNLAKVPFKAEET